MLAGIRPSSVGCPSGIWTAEANNYMKRVIGQKKVYGRVRANYSDSFCFVLLFFFNACFEGNVIHVIMNDYLDIFGSP